MFDKKIKKLMSASLVTVLFLMTVPVVAAPLTDPTQPPGFVGGVTAAGSTKAPAWQVSSILISSDRRMAVINGKIVSQGDIVGSAKVIRISHTAVTLRNNIETFTVKLLPAQVKSAREE